MGRDMNTIGGYALVKGTEYLGNMFGGPVGGIIGKTIGGSIAKNISRSGNEKSMPLLRSFWANAVAEEEARQATKWRRRQTLYETSGNAHGEEVSDVGNNNERGTLY
jgi:uncharacterized protein YcfJ